MDCKPSNPDTDSWVDDRMAKLEPSAEWTPDTARALNRLTQPKPSSNLQWTRVAMTTTILAATVLVLVMLPWQRLWTPKPVATVAAQAQTGPAEKAQEKEQVPPVKETAERQQVPEAASQATATPTAQQPKWKWDYDIKISPPGQNLPDNEADLGRSPTRLSLFRGGPEQASPSTVSEPVPVRNVLPEYSDEARKEKIRGTVIVTITVKTDGTVQFESFKQTLGYGLDEKAREAIEQWLFTPAKKDGVAVAKTVDISMNFSLK